MLKTELMELIANGENSGTEFKRDDIRPEQMAKSVVAFLNLQGGRFLLGVEDDGTITGLQRPGEQTQEWALNVFRDKVTPQVVPYYEEVLLDDGKRVGVITVPAGISKPYMVRHSGREDVYIRMGNRSELASREQQLRLFQSGGLVHVESLPVAGTGLDHLDLDRIRHHISANIGDPEVPSTPEGWRSRLAGLGMMASDGRGGTVCTVAGIVCFGIAPRRSLPQAGIRVQVYPGTDKEYQATLDRVLDRPLIGRWHTGEQGKSELIDDGLVEAFIGLVNDHISVETDQVAAHFRRERRWLYPPEAVREVVLNALAHRDWTRSVDIEVVVYADRLEVVSPGRLHNSMTVEKMLAGQRSPRNPLIMDILRDYGYVDARGMGIRRKVVPLMRNQNAHEPQFEATEDYLKTTLRRAAVP
jgi:ATP-dependent DNA helicase RecG